MSPRLVATWIVSAVLLVAVTAYCVHGEWKKDRLLRLAEGMMQREVKDAVGAPDIERNATGAEFGCNQRGAATVWAYRISDEQGVELVFDRAGKLICKTDYFLAI